MFSSAWPSLGELLQLDDGLLLGVHSKADRVTGLHLFQKGRGLSPIAHGHGAHDTGDLFMIHDNLLTPRDYRDDFAFSNYHVLAPVRRHVRAMPALVGHRHGWWRRRPGRWVVGKRLRRRQGGCRHGLGMRRMLRGEWWRGIGGGTSGE